MDKRYEDDRPRRRDETGLGAGAFGGAALGLLVGFLLPGVGTLVAAGLGGAAGGALGKALANRVSLDEWDPSTAERPYVGLHAPDSDETRTN